MALPPPNMEDCNPKQRCNSGPNAGLVYDPKDPCPAFGYSFNPSTCDCDPGEECDCNCHNDCGNCEICVDGICQPDPACQTDCENRRGCQELVGRTNVIIWYSVDGGEPQPHTNARGWEILDVTGPFLHQSGTLESYVVHYMYSNTTTQEPTQGQNSTLVPLGSSIEYFFNVSPNDCARSCPG